MSTKKSKPHTPRQFGKSDFKKLSPTELEKLGYSKKSERYIAPKNFPGKIDKNGTISKREQAKFVFNISNEEKAKKIKSGARPILDNAPKAARAAKIIKSAEKNKNKKPKKSKKLNFNILPQNIKAFPKRNVMRYDYFLGTKLDENTDYIIVKLLEIHGPRSSARIVVINKNAVDPNKSARTSDQFLMSDAAEFIPEFIDELLSEYSFLNEQVVINGEPQTPNIQFWLYVYSNY